MARVIRRRLGGGRECPFRRRPRARILSIGEFSTFLASLSSFWTFGGDRPQDLLKEPVTQYVEELYRWPWGRPLRRAVGCAVAVGSESPPYGLQAPPRGPAHAWAGG